MKTIILCAGKSNRFNQGYPKHIAKINGVPNIVRTITMLKSSGVDDITLSVSEENIDEFKKLSMGVDFIIGKNTREIDRFRNVFDFLIGKTLLLYGDVVYHKDDLLLILNKKKENNNFFFGRRGRNKKTKKNYGELFAFFVNDKEKFMLNVNKTAELFERGEIKREIGWDVYKVTENVNDFYIKTENFVDVSDITDDYDTYDEYLIISEIYKNL